MNPFDYIRWQTPNLAALGYTSTTLDVQKQLNFVGFNVAEDGLLGPETRGAIAALQRGLGVTVDGTWGPQTQAAYDADIPTDHDRAKAAAAAWNAGGRPGMAAPTSAGSPGDPVPAVVPAPGPAPAPPFSMNALVKKPLFWAGLGATAIVLYYAFRPKQHPQF